MSMAIHEALELLDPTEQTPHDLYAILTYAAAAHPDVAQMMDRFARLHRFRVQGEQQQREAAAAMGAEPRLVPMIPAPAPVPKKRRTGRPHGSYTRPKEVIEAERASREAKRAEIIARREARRLQKTTEAREKRESAMAKDNDKDFTYLVRRAEEELGWTGKYDNVVKPKSKPTSSSAKRKKDWYYYKAIDVKDSLMWMMKQLIREMSDSTRMTKSGSMIIEATYGAKKNALAAMRGIIHAVLVDTSEIGTHVKENWFAGLEDAFQNAMKLLGDGELVTLGKDKKWFIDMRELLTIVREQELGDETLKGIFSMVTPTAGKGGALGNAESEESEVGDEEIPDEESTSEDACESSEEEDADGESESSEEDELSGESSEEETSDEESSEHE